MPPQEVQMKTLLQYDVLEADNCILTGDIHQISEFFGKSVESVRKYSYNRTRVYGKYLVVQKSRKPSAHKKKRYILWDHGENIGIYDIIDITQNCFVSRPTVIAAARSGAKFAGRYQVMNYDESSKLWENACKRLRRNET